jgi:uncharacterized protein (DUF2141 family)
MALATDGNAMRPVFAPVRNFVRRCTAALVLVCLVAALAIAFWTGPACAAIVTTGVPADLTIQIENVLPAGGLVRLGVYDETRYPDDNSAPMAAADVVAVAGETIVKLHGLAPGIYAIETFQDVNGNGKMDTSWIGLPLEPFGFSQDATPFLSKPAFAAVKFTLVAGENNQVIHLQNSLGSSPAEKARDAVRARQRQ